METGTVIALIGACITAIGACGTVVAILVRMRRDIDAQGNKTDTIGGNVSGLTTDVRAMQKELSDLRVDVGKMSTKIDVHFGKPVG